MGEVIDNDGQLVGVMGGNHTQDIVILFVFVCFGSSVPLVVC